jgi:CBS domain-containing protein
LFAVPAHHFAGLSQLPLYAPLGVACGILAIVINKGLFAIEDGFRRLPVSQFWWPAIGALGFASVGLIVPRSLGVGYDQIGDVLNGRLAVGALAVLLVAKLVAWWVALASGTSGGTLAPILLISGCFGALLGHLAQSVPGVHVSPGAVALVAMAATFGAATRATFTSIVFLFELTRDYNSILPLMLATVLAVLVASSFTRESIMTEKLTRRGLRVPSDYHADVLRTTSVGSVMTASSATVQRDAAVAEAADAAGLKVVSVRSTDTVSDALERMLQEDVEHLPVVDDGELVGICTRSDIMRARRAQFAHEHTEPGWLSRGSRNRGD